MGNLTQATMNECERAGCCTHILSYLFFSQLFSVFYSLLWLENI